MLGKPSWCHYSRLQAGNLGPAAPLPCKICARAVLGFPRPQGRKVRASEGQLLPFFITRNRVFQVCTITPSKWDMGPACMSHRTSARSPSLLLTFQQLPFPWIHSRPNTVQFVSKIKNQCIYLYVFHLSLRGYLVLGWSCKQKRYSHPSVFRIESFEVVFLFVCLFAYLFFKPSWGSRLLKGKLTSCYLYKDLCAGELAWKLQPWVAGRSKEERRRKGHTPSTRALLGGLSASRSACCSGVCTGAQLWSQPCMLATAWPAFCQQPKSSQSAGRTVPCVASLWPPVGAAQLVALRVPLLQTQRLRIWKPNIQFSMWLLWLVFVDKASCGMASLCLCFSKPKGQTVALTPCIKAASASSIPAFNLLCLWGVCYIITVSSDDFPNYVTYRWFYFPYGWEKWKSWDMFEALVKDITQKSQTLVNLLLNGKKKKS